MRYHHWRPVGPKAAEKQRRRRLAEAESKRREAGDYYDRLAAACAQQGREDAERAAIASGLTRVDPVTAVAIYLGRAGCDTPKGIRLGIGGGITSGQVGAALRALGAVPACSLSRRLADYRRLPDWRAAA